GAGDVGTLIECFPLQVLQPLPEAAAKQTSDCASKVARLAGDLPCCTEGSGKWSRYDKRIRTAGDGERTARDRPVEFGVGQHLRKWVVALARKVARRRGLQCRMDRGERNGYRGHDDRVAGGPLQRGEGDGRRSPGLSVGPKQVQRPKRTAECHDGDQDTESNLAPWQMHVAISYGMTPFLLAPRSWCQQGVVADTVING